MPVPPVKGQNKGQIHLTFKNDLHAFNIFSYQIITCCLFEPSKQSGSSRIILNLRHVKHVQDCIMVLKANSYLPTLKKKT